MKKQTNEEEGRRPSATFRVGAIALVFLIIGYQLALFVYKASVTAVVAHRDRPDTVYVVDPALARRLLSDAGMAGQAGHDETVIIPGSDRGSEMAGQAGHDTLAAGPDTVIPGSDTVIPGSDRGSPPLPVRRDASHSPRAQAVGQRFAPRRYESFPFNPNTATEEELCRLGFTPKQAQAIIHYREKGGRFRRKEDFARSFVVADSVYERLSPYIRIPRVDLNTADSAAFDALPGIGPFYAGRIVSYRRELGGYSYPEQLMDLWKFDREKYDALSDLVVVSRPYRYPLWTLPEDSLKLHPYIRSYAAHGIVLFRSASPREDWTVEGLVKAGILKPEQGAKLARCAAPPPGE